MVYWSRNPVPLNGIVLENNRPFTLPRTPSQQDSEAVEATAYALLVRLARDGVSEFEERIVTWLNTMRMFEGGFVSIFVSSFLQNYKFNQLTILRDVAFNFQEFRGDDLP